MVLLLSIVVGEVDFHQLVHILDLHFHLIQVLENIEQLFIAWIIPITPALLLNINYILSQSIVILQILTQLMLVAALA